MLPPSFETDPSNWTTWQASVTRASGGQARSWAARAAFNGCGGCVNYTLDDSPNTVPNPVQGTVYTATAWVKADTAIGKPAQPPERGPQWDDHDCATTPRPGTQAVPVRGQQGRCD